MVIVQVPALIGIGAGIGLVVEREEGVVGYADEGIGVGFGDGCDGYVCSERRFGKISWSW